MNDDSTEKLTRGNACQPFYTLHSIHYTPSHFQPDTVNLQYFILENVYINVLSIKSDILEDKKVLLVLCSNIFLCDKDPLWAVEAGLGWARMSSASEWIKFWYHLHHLLNKHYLYTYDFFGYTMLSLR